MDTCLSRLPGMTFRTFSGLFVGVDKAFSMPWLSLIGVTLPKNYRGELRQAGIRQFSRAWVPSAFIT